MLSDVGGGGLTCILDVQYLFISLKIKSSMYFLSSASYFQNTGLFYTKSLRLLIKTRNLGSRSEIVNLWIKSILDFIRLVRSCLRYEYGNGRQWLDSKYASLCRLPYWPDASVRAYDVYIWCCFSLPLENIRKPLLFWKAFFTKCSILNVG